jgi:hypothetical protein
MKNFLTITVLGILFSCCTRIQKYSANEINSKLLNINYSSDSYYINKEYFDSLATKGIVIISEPHADVFTQLKLQKFLNTIHQHDSMGFLNFYCIEGSRGSFELDEFRELFQEDTSRFIYSIIDGKIAGWEYQLLKEENIRAYGVEDMDVYREQVSTFGDFYKNLEKRLYENYIIVFKKLYNSYEVKLDKIKNLAIKQILKGALNDILNNSEITEDSFLQKYTTLINPLVDKKLDKKTKDALNKVWEIGNTTNAYKNHSFNTDFYNILKHQLPDSTALISDMEKDVQLNNVVYIRDSIMVNNTIDVLNEKNLQSAILFIGNLHIKGITKKLKKNHISYVYFEHSTHHFDYDLYLKTLDI